MCGICGFAGLANEALLRGMAASLAHRGPDEDGFFSEGERVSLGMRRLRVIDLAGGSQPITNEDGAVVVVFNGEIYNFRELRRDLEAAGHKFKTNSDTETLVHLYEQHGERFPRLLRGMFAFALWDSKAKRLLLCRDQFGIKPLYYSVSGGKLYFASELKALRLAPGLCGELDPAAVDYYFTYLYIPAPLTVYKGVNKLEPATLLVYENGAARFEKYWAPPAVSAEVRPEEYYTENIKDLLSRSVKEQLASEVPLGLLLSGGLDSVSLLACMSDHAAGVKAFTASFGDPDFDETAPAAAAARAFGAEHFSISVKADIGETIRKLAGHFDEPFADSSALANYLVTREARRHVTVALAGIGGDELFAGYPRHLGARALPAYMRVPRQLRRLAGGALSLLPESRSSFNFPGRVKRFLGSGQADFGHAYNSWISYLSAEEKRGYYSQALLEGGGAAELPGLPRDPDAIMAFELGSYLPDDLLCLADRASMANSLELRVPFLDVRLAEFMAAVPLAVKTRDLTLKYLLKKTMGGRLPPEVLSAPKRGFQVPLARWQAGELKAFTAETLSHDLVRRAGVLSSVGVERMLAEHASGRRNLYDRIYAASVFHLWHEHARHNPPAALSGPWNVRGRRKILLVNMAGLGDIIMMTPALRALRAACPDAHIELLTIDRSRSLAEGLAGIDKIHSVPIEFRVPGPAGLYAFFRTLLALRRERFDALLNFSLVSSRGGLLKAWLVNLLVRPVLSSCRVLRGLWRCGDHCFKENFIERSSEVDLTSRLLAPLGVEVRDREIVFTPAEEDLKAVRTDLAARGIKGRPLIGLNPGAYRPSRRWPMENWKALCALLLEKYPEAAIVVTGSAGERDLADALKVPGKIYSCAGVFRIRENAALYSLTGVFITNDTGPMHIAAAAGARTVCIFGPGDHWRFAPSVPGDRVRVLRSETAACQTPCYKFKCPHTECLTDISPAQVLAAAEELLA